MQSIAGELLQNDDAVDVAGEVQPSDSSFKGLLMLTGKGWGRIDAFLESFYERFSLRITTNRMRQVSMTVKQAQALSVSSMSISTRGILSSGGTADVELE